MSIPPWDSARLEGAIVADTGIEKVVAAWKRRQSGAAFRAEQIGRCSNLVLTKRLRGVVGPQARRQTRADAIVAIIDGIQQAGETTTPGELNRCVQIHHACRLLPLKGVSMRMVRPLLPLLKRNPRTEEWTLRKEDQARGLVTRLDGLSAGEVTREVDQLLGRKPRRPKVKPSRMESTIKMVAKLSHDEQRRLHQVLDKTFGAQPARSQPQPIPDTLPLPADGKKSLFGRRAG